MANYKVTDTELTSIANAIRTKGGTQAQLEFPTGFVTAIGNIPSGGGGSLTRLTPYAVDLNGCYVSTGEFCVDSNETNCRCDVYKIEADGSNVHYLVSMFGNTVGNRERYMYTPTDVTQAQNIVMGTQPKLTGSIYVVADANNASSFAPIGLKCDGIPSSGYYYLAIMKANNGTDNIETFLYKAG